MKIPFGVGAIVFEKDTRSILANKFSVSIIFYSRKSRAIRKKIRGLRNESLRRIRLA